MSNNFQEEVLGKSYDSKLMGRLLKYARPYWAALTLCIVLLILISVIDLAQPFIIKIAIDDHINVYEKPIYVFDDTPHNLDYVAFQGRYYVKEKDYPDSDSLTYDDVVQLIRHQQNDYLVMGEYNLRNVEYEIIEEDGTILLQYNGELTEVKSLSPNDVRVFRRGDVSSLYKLSLLYLAIIVLGFLFNYIQVYVLNHTSNKIVYNIRQQLFSHLQGMSLSFFDKNPVGRLVTRVTNDTETLYEMYTGVLVNLFKDLFLLLGIVIVMLRMNVRLALISFAVIPLILISAAIFRLKIRDAYRDVRVKLAKINSSLNENFTGMKTIHIFKRENQQYNSFDHSNRELLDANKREIFIFSIFRPSMEVIRSLGMALLIWYGGGQLLRQNIEFGVLFAFISYLKRFFQPINDLTEKYNILQSAMASSERIFALIDKEPAVTDPISPVKATEFKGEIEFRNVWFAYKDEDWVLRDISFKINPGESVAFVGATGAGKSSIINLISRLYDIQKGEILIDGVNIKDYPLKELRKNIGVVLQDVFMFTGTIRDNIVLNQQNITDDRIMEIAEYVNAHSFIEKLPKGYNEPVMERGANLSTGQRQLLAFARALVFNPSILILDEATSNIDTETEELIQDAIVKIIKGRTTIAIAHRLSTIQNCSKIIVLHKGKIREMGNHQELLQNEGIYFNLYQLQYKESFTQ
ncbi:ABC transporter ATP-binding protein [Alkaliphilus peptidifermentans]|uniref:ATP-binding cassette, subfamily B, MsbA n=1 Tax=Alkaliphilus peptidifermentans DSM 18978 TaxID=1120976 RepID=A0A1G5CPQ0_9FIRM|nr:ABC transporter ATP-binding protein [Alkaliphilus peptidifermentans]SCY04382.1 ATP-binding cassette, subfamily B, MsbA [Alkaliphilus peptidifermentans DSM 18978]